jgi:site-specific DNA-methyltransferase (adenine-specific)
MTPYYDQDGITIYHGDCREILPLLEPVDLVLTDPPYNVGKDYGSSSDDDLDHEEYASFMGAIVNHARRLSDAHVWVAPRYKMALWWSLLPEAHQVVIPMRAGNAIRQGWSSKYSILLAVGTPTELHPDDLWDNIRHRGEGYFFHEENFGHPGYTPYPIMARAIAIMSQSSSLIVDPFMGSGTTLRAAKDLGRKAIGIEIEERYCEIAVKRLAQEVLPLGFT